MKNLLQYCCYLHSILLLYGYQHPDKKHPFKITLRVPRTEAVNFCHGSCLHEPPSNNYKFY